jgi:signal transduction protein with GAF and PtsI domain
MVRALNRKVNQRQFQRKTMSYIERFTTAEQPVSYDEMPSRLDMAVSLFTRKGTSEAAGSVHARSIRVPTIENVTIEALAQHSGLSVNKVICQLLEVALEEVFIAMPDEQREEVIKTRSAILSANMDKDGYPVFPGAEQAKKGEI